MNNNSNNNLYPQFDDLSDINFSEYDNNTNISNDVQSNILDNENDDNNVNENNFEYEQVFEMFPSIEKSLITELSNEMKFDDLIDLLLQLDNNESKEENTENEYSDSPLSLIGCENVPRRNDSILQTIRNRLTNRSNQTNTQTNGYFELSQFDKED